MAYRQLASRGTFIVTFTTAAAAALFAACGDDETSASPGLPDATDYVADAAKDTSTDTISAEAASDAGPTDAGRATDSDDGSTSCSLGDATVGTTCGEAGCVDLSTDPLHCGSCTNVCEAGATCSDGGCGNVVQSLTGLRWEIPCTSAGDPYCPCTDPTPQTATVQGATGVTYDVTLRFRGIVEQKTYTGSPPDGGAVATGTNANLFALDLTPAGDAWNLYSLSISDPPQTAYLNVGASFTPNLWPIDYTVTLPMTQGATVTLTAAALDNSEVINRDVDGGAIVVPDIPPAPSTFNGQFIQMDVVSVVPR